MGGDDRRHRRIARRAGNEVVAIRGVDAIVDAVAVDDVDARRVVVPIDPARDHLAAGRRPRARLPRQVQRLGRHEKRRAAATTKGPGRPQSAGPAALAPTSLREMSSANLDDSAGGGDAETDGRDQLARNLHTPAAIRADAGSNRGASEPRSSAVVRRRPPSASPDGRRTSERVGQACRPGRRVEGETRTRDRLVNRTPRRRLDGSAARAADATLGPPRSRRGFDEPGPRREEVDGLLDRLGAMKARERSPRRDPGQASRRPRCRSRWRVGPITTQLLEVEPSARPRWTTRLHQAARTTEKAGEDARAEPGAIGSAWSCERGPWIRGASLRLR